MNHLTFELNDIEKFIKLNNLKEVYDSVYFVRDNLPTPNGLLSNDIFGITTDDRKNTYAYIDLKRKFINPLCYIVIKKLYRKIDSIISGSGGFIINDDGYIEEDIDKGKTGLDWFIKNINNINFKSSVSSKRDNNILFIKKMIKEKKIFVSKWIVCPAGYRDANTANGKFGVGEINKLYSKLIMNTQSINDMIDYGINMADINIYRVQQTLNEIYIWFTKEPNLSKKNGVVYRAGLSKSTDYSARLVITAPDVRVNNVNELECKFEIASLPLSAACATFFPFNIFNMKLIINKYFKDNKQVDKSGNQIYFKDIDTQFTDYILKDELTKFIKGYANRLRPIMIETTEGKFVNPKLIYETKDGTKIKRKMLWMDIIFMACYESTKNRHISITRYPIETHFGQFYTKISLASVFHVEKSIHINGIGTFKRYPIISEELIGTNTSNLFIDTLRFSNCRIMPRGADYDGDQVTVKGVFTDEANKEIDDFIHSKKYIIGLTGKNIDQSKDEAIHTVYALTHTKDELKEMVF